MRLSYLTVCVDYLDYFQISYHHNKDQFDDFVVVTSYNDINTQLFCKYNNITCVSTDVFYRGGAKFNKGAALNEGLNVLWQLNQSPLDWVGIMDADTFVLPDFRQKLESMNLDKEFMYSCRRILVPTWEDYKNLWVRDIESYECPLGLGYGYLQLFNWDSKVIKQCNFSEWYPQSLDCTECDWKFRNMWGDTDNTYTIIRGNLSELPFKVLNLGPHGQNHFGRRSPKFIPTT